jgi:PIN like domain
LKLFVDENLPPQLARGLAALFKGDHEVTCHRDKFGQRCRLDEEWIPELGREGDWVILSGDVNIARKRPQRELFFRSNLVGFFPRATVMELPLPKKAARILSVWDRMVSIARDVRPGVFEVQQRGDQFKAL